MSKQPYINFWVGDYIRDTRHLTLEEKGAWTECLWQMHLVENRGIISGNWEDISLMIGANNPEKCKQILSKLQAKKICSLELLNIGTENEYVTIINRRMVREKEVSKKRSEIGKKGGVNSAKKRLKLKANKEANTQQNAGNGIGINTDINKEIKECEKIYFTVSGQKFHVKASDHMKTSFKSAMESLLLSNGLAKKIDEALKRFDSEYPTYQFTNDNHFRNSFKATCEKMRKEINGNGFKTQTNDFKNQSNKFGN